MAYNAPHNWARTLQRADGLPHESICVPDCKGNSWLIAIVKIVDYHGLSICVGGSTFGVTLHKPPSGGNSWF